MLRQPAQASARLLRVDLYGFDDMVMKFRWQIVPQPFDKSEVRARNRFCGIASTGRKDAGIVSPLWTTSAGAVIEATLVDLVRAATASGQSGSQSSRWPI